MATRDRERSGDKGGSDRLDIVIPVYNEGGNIIPVLESLARQVRTPYRVLICYDREDDTTLRVLRDWKNPSATVDFVKNPGLGPHSAVLAGFRASEAGAVVVYQADDTFNAGIVDALYAKFKEGNELAAPSRFIPGGKMEGAPWLKAILVRTAAFTLSRFAKLPVHDPTNGFRLFSRRLIEEIEIESTRGFTYSIEMLVKCHRLGWRTAEVPAQWFERSSGRSRFKVISWLPSYLRWYFYAFATSWLGKGPETVRRKTAVPSGA